MNVPVNTYYEAAHNWAQQLCTDSFLAKLQIASSCMIFDNQPTFSTKNLTTEEKTLLAQLVKHNEWSYALYQMINALHKDEPTLAQEHYVQIIAWAFGKESEEFNALHDHQYAIVSLDGNSQEEVLTEFMREYPNLYRKDGKPFLFGLLKKKKNQLLSQLLKRGANPDARCAETGDSVLHELGASHFSKYSHPGDTEYYYQVITLFKTLINARNNYGMAPLHEAVDNITLMKVLLEFDEINIDAQDESGETALHYAAHIFEPDYDIDDKVGKLLLKYGANPDIKNNNGLTYRNIINEKIKNFKIAEEFEMESYEAAD